MVLILNEQSAWLYPSILKDSLKMDYPFQIAYVQPPPQVSRFVQQEGKTERANYWRSRWRLRTPLIC